MSSSLLTPALALSLISPAAAPVPRTDDEALERIQERCTELLWTLQEDREFPGLAAALVLPDGEVLPLVAGFADEFAEREMTPEDRLLSGSIGKTYVTAAAHHLMLAGKLDFDRHAIEFFEGEEWFLELPNATDFTVRQLLRHQSGLPRYVLKPEFFPTCMADPDKVWTPEELLSWVAGDPPLFPAGEGWAYSDTNFIVVGMIIEKVSGQAFYDYVQENLLAPAGLEDTVPSDSRRIPGLTQGSCRMFPGMPDLVLEDGVFVYNPQFEWCGGGYASSAPDLARWAWLLYRGEAMEGDYLESMLDAVPAQLGPGKDYGLGVMVRETPLGRQIGHDGVMTGFQATMAYFDGVEVAGAILVNTDDPRALGMPADRLLERLATIAAEELD